MDKFCPQCGSKIAKTAKFCPHCGYDFSVRVKTAPAKHQSVKPQKKSGVMKKLVILAMIIVVVVAAGAYVMDRENSSASQSATSSAASSSATPAEHSVSSSSTSASSERKSGEKISSDIGPKGSAAAVTYFASRNNVDGWSDMTKSGNLEVDLSTDDDLLDCLAKKGQEMAYIVSDNGESGDRKLVYTIDEDNTINIYSLPADYDVDTVYTPAKSVAKDEMINQINKDHYAAAVKNMTNNVSIEQ